jgi:hypothetical protein
MASEAEMKLMVNGMWRGDIAPTPELDALRMIHAGAFATASRRVDHSGFRRNLGVITSMSPRPARSRTAS